MSRSFLCLLNWFMDGLLVGLFGVGGRIGGHDGWCGTALVDKLQYGVGLVGLVSDDLIDAGEEAGDAGGFEGVYDL